MRIVNNIKRFVTYEPSPKYADASSIMAPKPSTYETCSYCNQHSAGAKLNYTASCL